MKAAVYATIFLSLTLMTPTPSFSYTYYQFPPDSSPGSQSSERSQEDVVEQQQQTVDRYLEGLLQNLGAYENAQKAAEQQVEQAEESYEQAGDYFQDVFNKLVDAIYGAHKDTESEEQQDGMMTSTTSPQQESEDEDDGPLTTTVSFVITTTEADEDDMEVTTSAPVPTTTDVDDEESQDDDVTTVAPAVTTSADHSSEDDDITTTVAPATTSVDDASDDDDVETTTTAPTTVVIDRTLSTVDDVDDSDDSDEITTTTMPITPTDDDGSDEDEITTTAAPTTTTDEDDDDVTTAAPVATTAVPNMCDGCDFKHGVGYNPHPSDCTLFVQCRMDDKGVLVVAGIRSCPHGLYWNQAKLTCDFQKNVPCVDDICQSSTRKTKRSASTCRGFWDCSSGNAAARCCAAGFAFNPVTARCQYDPTCLDDCMPTHTPVGFECNGMRAVPGDRSVYEVKTGSTWTRMPCPPTLAFSEFPCGCNAPLNKPPPMPRCVPELYMPFTHDARDYSGRHAWVKNEGVLVKNGKAFFDGNSRLIVSRFANTWWGATVYVHLRYKSLSSGPGLRYSLVSNGDCKARPSLSVCAGSNGVEFYAETQGSSMPANFTVSYGYSEGEGWQDVLYRLDDDHLAGYVNTRMTQAFAQGALESRKHGLVIGSGSSCEDFEGFIDELTVYLCRPHYK